MIICLSLDTTVGMEGYKEETSAFEPFTLLLPFIAVHIFISQYLKISHLSRDSTTTQSEIKAHQTNMIFMILRTIISETFDLFNAFLIGLGGLLERFGL
jgi:hypothetical protein